MKNLEPFFKRLDNKVDVVRKLSRAFCEPLDITMFAHVRVYHDGRVSWITSDADHDRLLVTSGSIDEDPLIDTAQALNQGHFLWFHDREFPGSTTFYRERAKKFKLDHGMIVVTHHPEYLETTCFSGLLSKRPLYNLFSNEIGLFKAFIAFFKQQLSLSIQHHLEEGFSLSELKRSYGNSSSQELEEKRASLISSLGWSDLFLLSAREKECLALLREGFTYLAIGCYLQLSARTVEHYLNSVKNKLGLETQSQLIQMAHTLFQLNLLPSLTQNPYKY